jgi:hypothetical protein
MRTLALYTLRTLQSFGRSAWLAELKAVIVARVGREPLDQHLHAPPTLRGGEHLTLYHHTAEVGLSRQTPQHKGRFAELSEGAPEGDLIGAWITARYTIDKALARLIIARERPPRSLCIVCVICACGLIITTHNSEGNRTKRPF